MLTLKISKRFGSTTSTRWLAATSYSATISKREEQAGWTAGAIGTGRSWESGYGCGRSPAQAVLVAGNGSKTSVRAKEDAARLIDGLGTKPLALYLADEHLPFYSVIHCGKFVRRRSREGQDATGEVQPPAEEAGVECEEPIAVGRPGRSILAVAEEVEGDLIYLGAKGMSALKLFPLGNAYEEVLRHTYKTVSMGSAHPEGEGIAEAS